MDPLESVLRAVAQAAPNSWFPKRVARESQIDLDALYIVLEMLHLEGLIARGDSDPADGPGVVLTPAGAELLRSPDKLKRLRERRPLVDGDRGGEVRAVLWNPPQAPWALRLLGLNLAVFAYAIALAWPAQGLVSAYLSEGFRHDPRVSALLNRVGGMSTIDFLAGEYWRLVTSFFVHAGLLHLAFNMMILTGSGRQTEAMWPGWRFLLIYFISGLGCACVSLAVGAQGGVGASGALCGILAAEGWWFWINRSYLPRSAFRRFLGGFIFSTVMIVLISLQPGVGGLGHLGGAIFGALTAMLLGVQRYGSRAYRGPALTATLLLPLVAFVALSYAPDYNPAWIPAENRYYVTRDPEFASSSQQMFNLDDSYDKHLLPVLRKHPVRRDPDQVREALGTVATMSALVNEAEPTFARAGHYRSPKIIAYRTATLELFREWQAYLDEIKRCLEAGEKWTPAEDRAFISRFKALEASGEVWTARRQDLAK